VAGLQKRFPHWSFFMFEEINSTNLFAKNNLQTSDLPALVLALHQTNGQGQRGRTWLSQAGQNLTCSFCIQGIQDFKPNVFLIACAFALLQKIEQKTGLHLQWKWPNDIFLDGKKLAGLLIEAVFSGSHMQKLVIGFGLNVNQTNFDALNENATSLKQHLGNEIPLHTTLQWALEALNEYCLQKEALPLDVHAINDKLRYRNQQIHYTVDDSPTLTGYLIGVDAAGSLWVRDAQENFVKFSHEQLRILGPA
jgi:BirA family biotin operon repressor/biotin-[acetyl-CoA-carboxylase] ligase